LLVNIKYKKLQKYKELQNFSEFEAQAAQIRKHAKDNSCNDPSKSTQLAWLLLPMPQEFLLTLKKIPYVLQPSPSGVVTKQQAPHQILE
jgi:hypothetical protein